MKLIPDTTQGKVTSSLIVALVLVVAACLSGVGEHFHDSGLLMRLFLIFLGAVVVGLIFALQVIPGLVSVSSVMQGMKRLMRRGRDTAGRGGSGGP